MCLLLFRYGDAHSPFVLCSNRDESLARRTQRGRLRTIGAALCYAPIDEEAGGSWIAFLEGQSRFCVVLNYHDWRHPLRQMGAFARAWRSGAVGPKPSRGQLPLDFISGEETALAYAGRIARLLEGTYAGFNLIVGDEKGCYFVSNQIPGAPPVFLEPRRTHGISNGCLNDQWCKVSISRRKVTDVLECMNSSTSDTDIHGARALTLQLMGVMRDSTPLVDPSLGYLSERYAQVSAIFVDPIASPESTYGTRTTTIAVAYRDGLGDDMNCSKLLITENDFNNDTRTWDMRDISINYKISHH